MAKPSAPPPATTPEARAGRAFDLGLLALFLGLAFLLGVFPVKDTDLWWHLKAGDMIRQSGWVPTVDTLTFGAEGHRWVDLHWIFQLLVSFGFERVGIPGLNLAKCALTCMAVALLVTSGRRDWPAWATLLAWVPALLVLGGRMYVRPETLTLLYLAADVAILARWDRRPILALLLPVVQVLWVNSQGLFVFGPFLVGLALVDAATRPGAFSAARRGWWRLAVGGFLATVAACILNPYGVRGATYPIELAGTMRNPIFQRSIGELKSLPTLYAEVGLDSLPLLMHLATFALGIFSFLIPTVWRIIATIEDRRAGPAEAPDRATKPAKAKGKPTPKSRSRKSTRPEPVVDAGERPLRLFRLAVFLVFSGLSLAATRNSHQFAAVVGTVTGWNFAEWAAEVAARRRRLRPEVAAAPSRPWGRLATLGVLGAALVAVGSGRFYAWSGEGRTVGLGEEPFWYPHAATKFAGGPGMPDRNVGIHNGHPSLFEYYWAPGKKTYTDARLEVVGPELYQSYLNLEGMIRRGQPGWNDQLAAMGWPSVLVDVTDVVNGGLAATLLGAPRWRCVYFDAIAAVFVHESPEGTAPAPAVDFLARHYGGAADAVADPAALLAMTRSLRGVATAARYGPGGESVATPLVRLALDHARRLREVDPGGLDGFKQAGLLDSLLVSFLGSSAKSEPIPRFRMAFDPAIDLVPAASTYELTRALAIDPEDGVSLYQLATLYLMRAMDESAIPYLERFARQPNKNETQQAAKAAVAEQVAEIRRKLGPEPATTWKNLSELEQVFDGLQQAGRPAAAADVAEAAHPADARPWAWADRLATVRLHLGQPDRARAIWQAAADAPPALRAARVAAAHLVEGQFDLARRRYDEAAALDPNLFEAHYGRAALEQRAGDADAAVAAARRAEGVAPDDRARGRARQILIEDAPYRKAAAERAKPGQGSKPADPGPPRHQSPAPPA